jgi:spore coat protein U-like protein
MRRRLLRPRQFAWLLVSLAGFATTGQAAVNCLVSANPVNFGTYNPLSGSARDSTGQVRVTCTNSPPGGTVSMSYRVRLSTGSAAAFAPRQLGSGPHRLNYNLYTNNGRTIVWGDGTSGTATVTGSFNLQVNRTRSRNHTVYGRIPALQDPAAGSYTDNIVVTLEF